MTKYKVINLIDKIFISVAIFLFIFAWINFYTRNLWLTFILSLVFTFACLFLLFYFVNKKTKKNTAHKNELLEIDKCYFGFRLMSLNNQLHLLSTALKNQNTKIENEMLTYTENNKKIGIYIATEFETITENIFFNIASKFRDSDIDEIQIICYSFASFNAMLFKNKTFVFIDKTKLYKSLFLPNNVFPFFDDLNTIKKQIKLIDVLSKFFVPHKAKSYFICGLILIFSSIILPYHFYYIIFGSMFLLFSIICKLKKIICY